MKAVKTQRPKRNLPDLVFPGAVEAELSKLPKVAPLTVDLKDPEQQTWMNQLAAEREKGAPLTRAEKQRIMSGKPWRKV